MDSVIKAHKKRGKGILDVIKKGVNLIKDQAPAIGRFIKDQKLISKGLDLAGQKQLGGLASMAGFGKKKRRRRRAKKL